MYNSGGPRKTKLFLMDEQEFYRNVTARANEYGLNPLLLLSGIEGIYTFKDVPLSSINYEFLDSLILTIFALRIGDQFHTLATDNLGHASPQVRAAASNELREMNPEEVRLSTNQYLRSFAKIINGSSPIRKYHEKALEVAAREIEAAQERHQNSSIGTIVMAICNAEEDLGLSQLFG
jgi:hypothetical protein